MDTTNEKNLLLDRRYTCPVCNAAITAKGVKSGAAKLIDTAVNLRPMYQNIDVTKYDVVLCPECGYSALTKYFGELHPAQIMYLKEKVAANFKKRKTSCDFYSYDMAMERFKLALLSTVVKEAEPSEIGFLCLKISWLYESMRDELNDDSESEAKRESYDKEANAYSSKALEYLMKARMEEDFPICGMDMVTLDYLLAALSFMNGKLDAAMRMLSGVSSSREASDRLKNKAYDLKQMISEKQKEIENQNTIENQKVTD